MCKGSDLCECVVHNNRMAGQHIFSPTVHDHVIITICILADFTKAVTQESHHELLNRV